MPWFIGSNFALKPVLFGDKYDPIPTAMAIERIRKSPYGATVYESDGKLFLKFPSHASMF